MHAPTNEYFQAARTFSTNRMGDESSRGRARCALSATTVAFLISPRNPANHARSENYAVSTRVDSGARRCSLAWKVSQDPPLAGASSTLSARIGRNLLAVF